MNLVERLAAFEALGNKISGLSPEYIEELAAKARAQNGWFTTQNIQHALEGISFMLNKDKLVKWAKPYLKDEEMTKIVGIIMAGNIPLVGFHDLLCVLVSGHFAAIKPSSNDQFLTQVIIDWIVEIEPRFKKNIEIRNKLTEIDAVIATGSDNTSRYFEYYFQHIPSIIRKNRTSIAVLNGEESVGELTALGMDIFSYFGLGCRNVSKVFTPKGFDIRDIFPSFECYNEIIHHHKYRNNYDYHKSIYLVNKTPHLDTGFLLITSTDDLVSPISVLYHQEYENHQSLESILDSKKDKIQCIVGKNHIPFGQAQQPELWNYADNVDTMEFLVSLN